MKQTATILAMVLAFALGAVGQNCLPERVFADQAGRGKRKWRAEFGEIHEHIIRSAAGPLRLAADIGQLLALWIHIDHFDLVNDPISACQQSGA